MKVFFWDKDILLILEEEIFIFLGVSCLCSLFLVFGFDFRSF